MKAIRAALVVAAVLTLAQPASAGGSNWELDRPRYHPGDTAFAWAPVAWEHSDTLGTPEDGPYSAWLVPLADPPTWSWPNVPPVDERVATLVISLDPYEQGGVRFGPHHATVEFTVPDLPPGDYELVHCNTPCTTPLGDITFGELTIAPSPRPPPTTTAVAAAPLRARSGPGGPPSWLVGGASAVVLAGLAAAMAWLLRQPTVKPT
jgi:hypothetical protein